MVIHVALGRHPVNLFSYIAMRMYLFKYFLSSSDLFWPSCVFLLGSLFMYLFICTAFESKTNYPMKICIHLSIHPCTWLPVSHSWLKQFFPGSKQMNYIRIWNQTKKAHRWDLTKQLFHYWKVAINTQLFTVHFTRACNIDEWADTLGDKGDYVGLDR